VNQILHILIGDLSAVADAAIKTSALFLTAAILFLSPNDADSRNWPRSTG